MDTAKIKSELETVTFALQAFETSLAAHDVPLEVVSDFKSSVDDLRLRLWGLLTARSVGDHLAFQHRFRLRRTREMCLQLGIDLREEEIPVEPEELRKLAVAARALAAAASEALATDHTP
ncbi:MAG: hypothetical protein OEY20_08425 [Gemmatimonadota bacterium]|nr:hypothetical protein [Gemmatimonadota bacterium]MDH4351362.1 hypothetical protein [Gemmatimonadota bacterium]MDH5197262.1 hypothetical protein [Gemmatimonadota bacterium]